MRLASKIFLTSSLVILVLAGVGALSLRALVRTSREQALLAEAAAAFDAYRGEVTSEQQPRPARERALQEPRSRVLGERVEEALERLMEATYARVISAQGEAARLEARTWTGVLLALGAAVMLALVGTAVLAYRITRSLRRLSAATTAVAAGSYREPIPDALRDGVPGSLNPKQARLVTVIGHSTDRLLRLVNQMLELSRLRAGVLPLARERVDLARVVGRAVEELRPQAEEGGLKLTRERVGDDFDIRGDEDRLVQVVVNLVANAVRFTPRGGRVTVRLIDAGPEIEIQVEDSGVGIPATALPRIFDSWRQAHSDRGGTGLGLAVVRGVVLAHGGRVTVESQEGKGSRFTVLLPREP